ncbi:DUF6243 family protein [Spirillospora sp. CA-294931]|uniref:DUF6243 family protein n=1 Tax=Spirillospora sp. CA-294931 TaxID=3240042 RepID=UPI003D8A46B4
MSKSRNGMLGVGGQRKNLSRAALRGGGGGSRGGTDPLAEKRELLRKMRERAQEQESEATSDDE